MTAVEPAGEVATAPSGASAPLTLVEVAAPDAVVGTAAPADPAGARGLGAPISGYATATMPRPTPALRERLRQRGRRRAFMAATDIAVLAVTAAVVVLAGAMQGRATVSAGLGAAAAALAAWSVALTATRSRESRIRGASELGRIAGAAASVFVLGATWYALAPSSEIRMQLLLGVPAGTIAVLANRWCWRRPVMRVPRRRPRPAPRTILVGADREVSALAGALQRDGRLGYHLVGTTVVGARTPEPAAEAGGVPILGPASDTAHIAREVGADTVIVAGHLEDPDFLRRLSWQLEGTAAELVIATRLTDVAASRMSLRTASGLALVSVRIPTYVEAMHRVKRMLDVLVASCALVPIALATPVVALAIRLDSPGPVFFRQQRIGRDGRAFDIVKFRTMRVGAEDEVAALQAENQASGALFKLHRDPRVTRAGAVLRKYSIDELPQFWNVLKGDMSVVGPRPPLPREVSAYDDPVFRRLYIRPGITGPWQIGGRSDLSWEEGVRLDLHYVENWSVALDIGIMLRTAAVVFRAKGAY